MNVLPWHMMAVFMWAVSLLSLIKSVELKENSRILAFFSFVLMLLVLFLGTKLMLMFPKITKTGMWLHIKLSIDIIEMLINVYFVYIVLKNRQLNQKIALIFYWSAFVMFVVMYYLTLFKPF